MWPISHSYMRQLIRRSFPLALLSATLFCFDPTIAAQQKPKTTGTPDLGAVRPRDRVTTAIDDTLTVARAGNIHPMARPEYDRGRVAPEHRMDRMLLALQPTAAQQEALETLIQEQQNPESPYYQIKRKSRMER